MISRMAVTGTLAAALTLAVGGCVGNPPAASTARTGPPTATLRVGLLEWRIVTSGAAVLPGDDRFIVTNTGTTAHDLHVTGPGMHANTPILPPGHSATLSVTAPAGATLRLSCELPGHERAGMHATVTVTR